MGVGVGGGVGTFWPGLQWTSPSSPSDGLAGILGGRIVHAVEVVPLQDIALPLGLGV